ncbi:MAG: thermonuclease family protein [Alcanivoracaceae bacterium]|nr:thermonuclease family protein [Alcanivoracaceae bacterium]
MSDGDTLRVSVEGTIYKVRLYGIDTPEYKQAFGSAAKQALEDLVEGKQITLKEREQDRYGRLVATVYADGENVNLQLVENGYAWWYRDYATFNVPLALAEFSARRDERGLWQSDDPTPPWEWRSNRR